MVRPISFLLGFWLTTLFVVGQDAHPAVPRLLLWADGLGAALAIMGGMIAPIVPKSARLIGPLLLSLGLFAVSFVALLMDVTVWFTFCTFMGTAIFLAVVIADWVWSPRNRGTMAPADS